MPIYQAWNGPSPTTAAQLKVTTAAVLKTLLQLEDATNDYTLLAWGVSFDGAAVAAGIECELVEQDVADTVTAHVAAGLIKWDDPNAVASAATLGTANTGYSASVQGSPTVSREFDVQTVQPAGQYLYEFSLGQRPKLLHARFAKIRVTAPVAVNALAFIRWSTD